MADPYPSSTTETGGTYGSGGASATADAAKEQATNLKDKATDAGGHLLGEAKGEASAVTQEAKRQLGDLFSQARSEVSGQAGAQQTRLAGGLTTVADQLGQMASAPTEQNLATDLVRGVGEKVGEVGQWLESHGPDEVLDEVRRFARRRPGTFLVIAAGAGIVLGRLTRGLKDAPATTRPSTTPTPAPAPAPIQAAPLVQETAPPSFAPEPVTPTPLYEPPVPAPATTSWDQR